MNPAIHPRDALFAAEKPFPSLPVCEHIAGNERFIRKAVELQNELSLQNNTAPLFDITCDCEDGAAAGDEAAHAAMVGRLIAGDDNRHGRLGARIHDVSHPAWKADIETIIASAGSRIAYLTLPKANGAGDVLRTMDLIRQCATRAGIARDIPLHVLIETHGGLADADAIAATPGVETLDFGIMDFVAAHHGAIPARANRSPGQFEHHLIVRAKTNLVAAALAHGVVPTHNVTLALNDTNQVFDDALRARREFGFLRMWSIHPNQIQPIVDALKPDYAEVGNAAEVLLAAARVDWAPVRYLDELYDRASYRYCWHVLERARATGVEIPAAAEKAFFTDDKAAAPGTKAVA